MKLNEQHKEFAVKCFARFMTRTEVVKVFLKEFENNLPPPPEFEKFSEEEYKEYYDQEETIEEERIRKEYIAQELRKREKHYAVIHGTDASTKFEEDREKLQEEIQQTLYESELLEAKRNYYQDCQGEREDHSEELKRDISNQLRRFNITHPRFPNKYRDLFNRTREQHFNKYRGENLGTSENIRKELETLHGYVKQAIFQEQDPKEAMKHINLAHQILKTLVACNALNAEQDLVNITPQDPKPLEEKK
ncbi:MAG: hypothetical protein OXL96_21800 [Candidatus Poribacteria bacterium]|nr:hypothetical protein [Candidatus Poribacteria bacterium]